MLGPAAGQRIGYIEKNPIYRDRYDVYDARTGMRSGIYLDPILFTRVKWT